MKTPEPIEIEETDVERLIGPGNLLGTEIAPVTVTVAAEAEIDLGGRMLDLAAWPVAHTFQRLALGARRRQDV